VTLFGVGEASLEVSKFLSDHQLIQGVWYLQFNWWLQR